MKTSMWLLTLVVTAGTVDAADDGTQVWAQWQGRVSIGNAAPVGRAPFKAQDFAAQRPGSLSLVGDYYLFRSLIGHGSMGGMRATGGVILGPRSQAFAGLPGAGTGGSFSIGSRLLGTSAMPYTNDVAGDLATLPYLGLGYTGLSTRSGWSFSADLGLLAQSPGNVVRFGRGQSLDDVVRELRLAPMLQLGVSYAF